MRCYRVYSAGECVGTFFNMIQAVQHQELFLKSGLHATVEIEKYEC